MAEGGRKVVIGVDESSFAEEAFNCEYFRGYFYTQFCPMAAGRGWVIHTLQRNMIEGRRMYIHTYAYIYVDACTHTACNNIIIITAVYSGLQNL